MITRRPAAALLGAAIVVTPHAPARACGGMVFQAHEERLGGMSDQELLVLFGADETVLVASAGYTGVPAGDFAFILPLAGEPLAVQDGDNALFIALDEYAAPRVAITVEQPEPKPTLCGGLRGDGGANGDLGGDGDVMVHQRGSTATYDYVVIGGDTGTAVADWLTDAGYTLPADYAAALDPYVAGGSYFFAARVKADADSGALAPIELHLPPGPPETFKIPYGIAAHSLAPGASLRLTTYFYAAGPVLPGNYAAQAVDVDDLEALSETESNYADVEREILDSSGGAFVIDHSAVVAATSIRGAFDDAVEAGRVDTSGADPAYITDLFERTGVPEAHLTRLRTDMGPDVLGDMTLRRADGPEVQNYYSLHFDPDAGESHGGCAIDRSGNLAQFLLLVPVLAWIRPRRRSA
jgi:hypothetical protein